MGVGVGGRWSWLLSLIMLENSSPVVGQTPRITCTTLHNCYTGIALKTLFRSLEVAGLGHRMLPSRENLLPVVSLAVGLITCSFLTHFSLVVSSPSCCLLRPQISRNGS